MARGNLQLAYNAMAASKWRSFMTMLGIIIGIVSVVTIVAIGDGVKQQIASQNSGTNKGVITVRPGQLVNRNAQGDISSVSLLPGYAMAGSLDDQDTAAIRKISGVEKVAPLSALSGSVTVDNKVSSAAVIGTTSDLPSVLGQKVAYGDFFSADDSNENGAVIGSSVARDLFGQDVPLGQSFSFQGRTFVVRGIFAEFKAAPLSLDVNYNQAIFVPYQVAKDLSNNRAPVYEIQARVASDVDTDIIAGKVETALRGAHGGQTDFTVLRAGENLGISGNILDLLTRLIGIIAIIALLVGGIGITNVMLVSVTERMQEIGIRKAVGATSRQIMGQFLAEATVLSITAGIIGVIVSLLIILGLRVFTDLDPVLDWHVLVLAVLVSVAVGIIFGTAPAIKAARKDPIDALRNE